MNENNRKQSHKHMHIHHTCMTQNGRKQGYKYSSGVSLLKLRPQLTLEVEVGRGGVHFQIQDLTTNLQLCLCHVTHILQTFTHNKREKPFQNTILCSFFDSG